MEEGARTIGDLLSELYEIHYSTSPPPPPSRSGSGAAATGPASREAIEALKNVPITGGDDADRPECAICLDHGTAAAAAAGWKEMPCGHQFHGACLEEWLRAHCTCPVCRHQMPTTPLPPAEEDDDDEEAGGGRPELRVVLALSHPGGSRGGTRRNSLEWE